MRLRILTIGALITSLSVYGQTTQQRQCGAELLKKQVIAKMPNAEEAFRQTLETNVADAKRLTAQGSNQKTTATPVIPVVFHIVLSPIQITALGGEAGIAERVDSQLAVINRDFNKANPDSWKIPAAFKPLYGNVGISFGKALRKPDGSSSPGYEIIGTAVAGFEQSSGAGSGMGFAEAKFTNGVPNAWDPEKYLNIWVLSLKDNGKTSNILGLTMPPSFLNYNIPGLTSNELGIVLSYGAFGVRSPNVNYFTAGVYAGRTLTHELGHYFEVWHVWGDDDGKCVGSGGKDDGISDTPPQASATYGCPSFPSYDACTTSGNGIMFMNFMDYVNDTCMQMFTEEQARVMSSQLVTGKESHSLTQHPELLQWTTSVINVNNTDENTLNLYPNPTAGIVTISSNSAVKSIQVSDVTGALVQSINVDGVKTIYNLDLSGKPKGVYIVHCATASGNKVQKLVVQ